ncbi:pentatricopeptide repeat-containing protein, putative [Perkinsus marinus ATCC 50983]|uniref:Pentatricopeptide repeat-containing protein, putative n=1 Tax=Perkinsus marinus (strain ATCC 50983 / TXsc) TaxID=423536 RepID=C5LK60_PERM5|nr:pentatricopeptide repeat-containing protein, putative [Perkinsus marinus ATCC 50983]EER02847.1 pentatricopeptide repeat-containing protein, putative [Perkinsus marinus ATCC 50983]|eukprot:XP_002771031.1 pentatricopeptide repeat-containing protein, putative [Perkinsus marinus ATCC 50983]
MASLYNLYCSKYGYPSSRMLSKQDASNGPRTIPADLLSNSVQLGMETDTATPDEEEMLMFTLGPEGGLMKTRSLCGALSAIAPPRCGVDGRVILQFFNGCLTSKNATLALETYFKYKEEKMPTADPAMNLQVMDKVIKVLAMKEQWEDICNIYTVDMQPSGLSPDPALCSLIVFAAVRAGRHELADMLFRMHPKKDDDFGMHMAMIRSYGLQGDLGSALELFTELKAAVAAGEAGDASTAVTLGCNSSGELSPFVYNCLLDAAVQCDDMDVVGKVFEEMKGAGRLDVSITGAGVPNVVSFNTVMKGHLKQGNMRQARKTMREMQEAGFPPNVITYNELLHSMVQGKDKRGIWEVVEEMKANGLPPNKVTCSILLKALTSHSHASDVVRTMELVERMRGEMDEVLFSSVIEACIRIGKLDILSNKLQQYILVGSQGPMVGCRYTAGGGLVKGLTAPTYGSMIKAYGHAKDLRRVWSLWSEMRQRAVKPTAITLGCMVDALVTNRYPEDALSLIHEMLNTPDCADCVNTIVYSTVLKGFALSKQVDRVFDIYQEMRSNKIPLNTVSFNTIMDACARSGSMERVSDIFREMDEQGIEPDIITYSTVVKGYCLAGDVDTAFSVLRDMSGVSRRGGRKKFAPDEIMYNSLLDGCAKQHRVDQALQLLDEMRANGVAPSNYTLSILVKLLGRARRLLEAFNMVEDLSTAYSFRANVHVYTCLIQACVHNKQLQRAMKLHDAMIQEYRVDPDQKTYAVLARGCIYSNQLEMAAKVVRCAYGLPSPHGLAVCRRPPGMEARVTDEILNQISQRGGRPAASQLAAPLLSELRSYCGVRISDDTVGVVMGGTARHGYQTRRDIPPRCDRSAPPPSLPLSSTLPPLTHNGAGLDPVGGSPQYSPVSSPIESPQGSISSVPANGMLPDFQLPMAQHYDGRSPFFGPYPGGLYG